MPVPNCLNMVPSKRLNETPVLRLSNVHSLAITPPRVPCAFTTAHPVSSALTTAPPVTCALNTARSVTFCNILFHYSTFTNMCSKYGTSPAFPCWPFAPLLLLSEIDCSLFDCTVDRAYPRRYEEPSSRSGNSKRASFFPLPRKLHGRN